jgi:hypothetical protein
MGAFEDVHRSHITGSLAMFDRMIFKGHFLRLYHPGGVQAFLWNQGVPLTQFAQWAKATTDALCQHAQQSAEEAGRPYIYLEKTTTMAEKTAGRAVSMAGPSRASRNSPCARSETAKKPCGASPTSSTLGMGRAWLPLSPMIWSLAKSSP